MAPTIKYLIYPNKPIFENVDNINITPIKESIWSITKNKIPLKLLSVCPDAMCSLLLIKLFAQNTKNTI